MTVPRIATAEDLYERLVALPGIEVFLLADGAIYGVEGLAGLRLIALALYESVQWDDDARQKSASEGQHSPHLAQAEALLDQCKGDVDYIVCFHFDDEPGWHMRWSDGWSHMDAAQELVEVIRHGIVLDQCWE